MTSCDRVIIMPASLFVWVLFPLLSQLLYFFTLPDLETKLDSKSSSKLWHYHQILVPISTHAVCLLFAFPETVLFRCSVSSFLFEHLLLSAQKGLQWQLQRKSHHLWVRNCLSKVLGRVRNKNESCTFAKDRLTDSTQPSSAKRLTNATKVHIDSCWCQWGIGGVPWMAWWMPFLR